MFQTIQGKELFVVDLPYSPNLPILADVPGTEAYAEALTTALKTDMIRLPGKFGIEVDHTTKTFNIYRIKE